MLEDAAELERYFRDPIVGDGVLGQGSSGLACKNIRMGLRFLDLYEGVDFPETYDAGLAHDILRFREAYKHTSRDGQFGPGTRRLLTRALLEKTGEGVFKRMADPERRERGQIFISYARADSRPVRDIAQRIRGWGYTAWYDDSISGSEHFNASIQRAIEDCYLLLVCLSEASVRSDWVVKEVMFANQAKKQILPVRIGPVSGSNPLALVLINHQALDASQGDFTDRLKTAIKTVRTRVSEL